MSYGPFPKFLTGPDPDWRDQREWMRDAYALRGSEDRAMELNYGFGSAPFTVEDALAWAERLAGERLP